MRKVAASAAALAVVPVLAVASPAMAVECWQVSPDVHVECCNDEALNKVTRKLFGQDWFACLA